MYFSTSYLLLFVVVIFSRKKGKQPRHIETQATLDRKCHININKNKIVSAIIILFFDFLNYVILAARLISI